MLRNQVGISNDLKSIQKTFGLSKSKLQLLGWLNYSLFSYCPVGIYDFFDFSNY
jgi:hypothetical protein